MRDPQFERGTILAEKYRLDSRLGEGGMGTVYRATHLLLKAPVAIKVIDREVSAGDVALSRFMREAQAAASLRSPHVVQVLDYGTEKGRPFMVMELLEGESLADRIDRLGKLTPAETYRVLSHVARAMAKAHEAGIIHRDLKPDNVFLVHNEGDELAKVLDFGVAKVDATALGGEGHTRTGSLLGTPYYMSPEQAQGNKEVDHRSDLWALGVIAFECLTGKRPFYSDGLGDVVLQICIRDIPKPSDRGDVPPGFDAWFLRAAEREVSERFQSAREMIDALGSALGLPAAAAADGPWSTTAPAPRSSLGRASEEATTEKDPLSGEASDRLSETQRESGQTRERGAEAPEEESPDDSPLPTRLHRTEGQGGARWEESVDPPSDLESAPGAESPMDAPKDSQWEIVPHGEFAAAEARPRNLALEMALAEDHRRPGSVLLIGLLFLMLGAGAVLLVRGFVGPEASSPADLFRRLGIGKTEVAAPRPQLPREPAPAGPSQADLPGAPTSHTPSAEKTTPAGSPQGARLAPTEEQTLDAIDAAASKQAEAEGEATVAPEDEPSTEPQKGKTPEPPVATTAPDEKTTETRKSTGGADQTKEQLREAGPKPTPEATEPPPPGPQPQVPSELSPAPTPPPSP